MTSGERVAVHSEGAPRAIGPYSQAIVAGGFAFTSGQIPIDPLTGKLVEGGIEAETRRVLDNLASVLAAAGTSLSHVVKATIYLTALSNFSTVNAVYAGYFPADPPARSTVQVAALPLGASVEIDLVAVVP